MTFTISDHEIAILNAARSVLVDLSARTRREYVHGTERGYALGRTENEYDRACQAIFTALSTTHAYLGVTMTDHQLYNREAVEA